MKEYSQNKYYVNGLGLLTEDEKLQMAKNLLELERRGVLEYRDGRWGLAPGIEIEETPDGPVACVRRQHDGVPGELASSVTSSGEPSEARVPPLEQAARPLSQAPGSPDSDDEVSKQ